MTKNEKRLAAELLRMAADEFSNHGCNDYEFPAWFKPLEQNELMAEYEARNGKELDDTPPGDWEVFLALADKLEAESK